MLEGEIEIFGFRNQKLLLGRDEYSFFSNPDHHPQNRRSNSAGIQEATGNTLKIFLSYGE
jgi:hypothetical protein